MTMEQRRRAKIRTADLYQPGTRIHLENATKHGATAEEIMEVLAVVSVPGVHTIGMGLPGRLDELETAETRGGAA